MVSEIPAGELENTKTNRTEDIEAYDYFLKGQYYHEKKYLVNSSDEESFKLAEMMFKKSISQDSTFALPHTAMADLYHSYYVLSATTPEEKQVYYGLIGKYLNTAFRLDTTSAYNYLVKGRMLTLYNDVDNAFTSFKKAIQLNPNNGWYNEGLRAFLFSRGLHHRSLDFAEKAISLDPLVPIFYVNRGLNHQWLGNVEEAEADYLQALRLEPNLDFAIENYIHLLIEDKRFQEVEAYIQKLDTTRSASGFLQTKFLAAKGEKQKAIKHLGNTQNLQILGLLGMNKEAREFYKYAIEQEKNAKVSYYWLYKTNSCYDKLRYDQQFQKYLKEHKKIYEKNLRNYGDL